jgi:hypothetical protein
MRWFVARCPAWLLVPALDHEFRRLLVWSYVLAVRVRVLRCMVTATAWFATAGLAAILRRRSDILAADIEALNQAIRDRRRRRAMTAPVAGCRNPWT